MALKSNSFSRSDIKNHRLSRWSTSMQWKGSFRSVLTFEGRSTDQRKFSETSIRTDNLTIGQCCETKGSSENPDDGWWDEMRREREKETQFEQLVSFVIRFVCRRSLCRRLSLLKRCSLFCYCSLSWKRSILIVYGIWRLYLVRSMSKRRTNKNRSMSEVSSGRRSASKCSKNTMNIDTNATSTRFKNLEVPIMFPSDPLENVIHSTWDDCSSSRNSEVVLNGEAFSFLRHQNKSFKRTME